MMDIVGSWGVGWKAAMDELYVQRSIVWFD
jgi:hypothetical protein